MEDISSVVRGIVAKCEDAGVPDVSETLAAFVAKTTILERPDDFRADKELTNQDIDRLVDLVVARLQRNDANTQTLRMQVAFDEAFVEAEHTAEAEAAEQDARLQSMADDIAAVRNADFEAAKALYRQVFNLLVSDVRSDDAKHDEAARREIAAALESVFPRAGLPAFASMPADEKLTHLQELRRVVRGIRIFNLHLGKGGAGIPDAPRLAREAVYDLSDALSACERETSLLCERYSAALVRAHAAGPSRDLPAETLRRWKDEHTNRRQLLSYVSCLLDDARQSETAVQRAEADLDDAFAQLGELVGQRASLPKSTIYPLFDAVGGDMWPKLERELETVRTRVAIWTRLQAFVGTCPHTLDESKLPPLKRKGADKGAAAADSGAVAGEAGGEAEEEAEETLDEAESKQESKLESKEERTRGGKFDGRWDAAQEGKHSEPADDNGHPGAESKRGDADAASKRGPAEEEDMRGDAMDQGQEGSEEDGGKAVLLMPDAPGFSDLVLGLQAFCPHTAVSRDGLLLQGDAQLGVVQFRGQNFVFQSRDAMRGFMAAPARSFARLLDVARAQPELIHLLQLEPHFPQVAMGAGLRGGRSLAQTAERSARAKADASTETPLHFVERHVDPNYHWNEWELRRRALRTVNLRNARTRSVQTTASHFRREAETQVYLPRETATQTGVQRGTNPPRQHQFVVGLRGDAGTRFARTDDADPQRRGAATVVNLTYDL